jgi:periplasmic protein TonB
MLAQAFDTENSKKSTRDKSLGWVTTLVVHALIAIALLLVMIAPHDPPFEDNEGGMTVNYGTSAVGTGDVQPMTAVPVTVQQDPTPTPAESTPAASPEDLETQDKEDAAVVEKKTEVKKKTPKPIVTPIEKAKPTISKPAAIPAPPTPQVDKNALFKPGAHGKPNKSTGDGEGHGIGDQGDQNGDPNSHNYHGGGTGNGIGKGDGLGDGNVRLAGRKLRSRPSVNNPCEALRGKVVVTIKVNKSGRVTSTSYSQSGSTTSDDCLVGVAQKAAAQYVFDTKDDAADVQTGSIVFIFKEH